MKTAGKVVLVTGANRGLGRALVEEALKSGATKVYAGTRSPLPYSDDRVVSLILDVTSRKEIRKAADKVESLDLLINNAGIAFPDDLSVRSAIERHLAVKLFGMNDVTQAFLPMLIRSQGAVANILSRAALAPLPFIPAYSISDAAAFSLTLSLRRLLAARGVRVHAIMPGSIDTDMSRGFDVPGKSTPTAVAREILSAIERGDEEIFPDPMSVPLAKNWRLSPTKELERQFVALARKLSS